MSGGRRGRGVAAKERKRGEGEGRIEDGRERGVGAEYGPDTNQ
jgi:hypothetical protein